MRQVLKDYEHGTVDSTWDNKRRFLEGISFTKALKSENLNRQTSAKGLWMGEDSSKSGKHEGIRWFREQFQKGHKEREGRTWSESYHEASSIPCQESWFFSEWFGAIGVFLGKCLWVVIWLGCLRKSALWKLLLSNCCPQSSNSPDKSQLKCHISRRVFRREELEPLLWMCIVTRVPHLAMLTLRVIPWGRSSLRDSGHLILLTAVSLVPRMVVYKCWIGFYLGQFMSGLHRVDSSREGQESNAQLKRPFPQHS